MDRPIDVVDSGQVTLVCGDQSTLLASFLEQQLIVARQRLAAIDDGDNKVGNGASLGTANHLYFAAGPNKEEDGLFGKLAANPRTLPPLPRSMFGKRPEKSESPKWTTFARVK